MRVVGRFEIVERIVSGACETYSARDPKSAQTVLVHLLEAGGSGSPEDRFRAYAPDCPGAVLESGTDHETRRDFVVTEYPKDRKALMLLIRQLGVSAAKPKPAEPPPPPPHPSASDGATRMLDPSAIFGAAPRSAAPPPAAPAPEGATRMLDASALASHLPPALGHPPARHAAPAPPSSPAEETKKPGAFTQAFAFEVTRKTGERPRVELPKSAPATSPSQPPAPPPASGGETRAFSSAALANMLPNSAPSPVKPGPEPKAVRVDSAPAAPPPDTGETKAFSSAALAGMLPKTPPPKPAQPPASAAPPSTPQKTAEMPAPLRPASPIPASRVLARTTPVRPSPTPAVITPAPLKRAPSPPPEESKWSPATLIAIGAVVLVIVALIVYVLMK